MDFDERLKRAIDRGQSAKTAQKQSSSEDGLSTEDLRNIYSAARLNLTEHIENCLRKLTDHFPGFRFETIVGESGWGAKISRDDLALSRSGRANQYSRLELLVKPFSEDTKIVNVVVKGTIRNKELVNRSHYQFLSEFNETGYKEVIDLWIVEFAEKYAATR